MTRGGDFWARRKAAVAEAEESERAALDAQPEDARRAELEEKSDAEVLEELGLPEPETLQPGDDFAVFMEKAVPDRIRRRALRMLWRSNPVLANVDGLVDYGEDFTDSAMVVENLQTAYQVGKGMLAHIEKLAADAERKAAPDVESEDDDEMMAEAEVEDTPEPIYVAPDQSDDEDGGVAAPAPRRMTFTYESDTA